MSINIRTCHIGPGAVQRLNVSHVDVEVWIVFGLYYTPPIQFVCSQ